MTTLTLQPDEASAVDTYINSSTPTTNYGTATRIGSGEDNTAGAAYRSLIKFDLSGIPVDATINSATLYLTTELDRSSNARDHILYRVLRDWIESEATWNVWKTATNWTIAGAGGSGDYSASPVLATTNLGSAIAPNTEVSWSISTTEFTKFVDGTYANYGFLLRTVTQVDDAYTFHSSNSATASYRPKLVVEYSLNNGFFLFF